jgi:hypothetical protein
LLANCISLELLDIGNNHIECILPFYWKNTYSLRVIVLRANKFYGSITQPRPNATWPMLQIVDVASNNFTDCLPIILIPTSKAMIDCAPKDQHELNSLKTYMNDFYVQDTVTITYKGLEIELVKILTIFTTIDFSCNHFDSPIPEEQ